MIFDVCIFRFSGQMSDFFCMYSLYLDYAYDKINNIFII
jgi:hypothetical protein